jgi:uracil phosphoribosyltransferase
MRDTLYKQLPPWEPPQLPHRYGPNVRLSACPLSLYELARLSAATTQQPLLTRLVRRLYTRLLDQVVAALWPVGDLQVPTRMAAHNDRGIWQGCASRDDQPVVVVDIARAGTVPAQTVYDRLTDMFPPDAIRQDHLVMARQVDAHGQVIGAQIQAQKIDGAAAGATVLIPDPMGATGNTLAVAADLYKKHEGGAPCRIIALHLIVTPEYLRHMAKLHPDVQIWALRLDRGMSSDHILATVPGTHPDEERGLNERHYIIPGAGGMGELLNNTHG